MPRPIYTGDVRLYPRAPERGGYFIRRPWSVFLILHLNTGYTAIGGVRWPHSVGTTREARG